MTFEDRIRTALPFLRDTVVGLKQAPHGQLWSGGPLFHLDIKPANIYVRRDDTEGHRVRARRPRLPAAGTRASIGRWTPRSTICRSARSITGHRSRRSISTWPTSRSTPVTASLYLDVRDPKFSGSFVEKGDSVLFSRDKTRTRHIIVDIILGTATAPARVQIAARSDPSQGRRADSRWSFSSARNTGPISSASGQSRSTSSRAAGRRSASTRAFAASSSTAASPGSVESTIAKYRRVKDGLADEPELVHIFEPLRHGSEYTPETYVELILRCMLYNAEKTFYAPYGGLAARRRNKSTERRDSRTRRSRAILDVLAFIDNELDYRNNSLERDNPLITQRPPKSPASKGRSTRNHHQSECSIPKMSTGNCAWPEPPTTSRSWPRWCRIGRRPPNHPFLYQMLPAGIRWGPRRAVAIPVRVLGLWQRETTI